MLHFWVHSLKFWSDSYVRSASFSRSLLFKFYCLNQQFILQYLPMQELLEYEKFLGYLNQQVSPATLIFFILSTIRTYVAGSMLFQPGFLSLDIDAHWLIVVMLLVQWTTISIAPLVSVISFVVH